MVLQDIVMVVQWTVQESMVHHLMTVPSLIVLLLPTERSCTDGMVSVYIIGNTIVLTIPVYVILTVMI